MENKHPQAIPAALLAENLTKMGEIATSLKPYLVNLTPEERRSLPKLGNKSLSFGEKAFEYAEANPELYPAFLNLEDFKIDMQDATGLRVLGITAQQISQGIEDTVMLAGSEAYHQALLFYGNVKTAAASNIPGAKTIYEDLKARFPTTGRRAVAAKTGE
jgi:hypothetical protein